MRIGQLRHLVTLQQPTEGVDEYGNPTTIWVDVGQAWAAVEPVRGQEQYLAQQTYGTTTYRVRIRHRQDVSVTWRVVWEGRVLEVKAALDVDGRHRELALTCIEVVQ